MAQGDVHSSITEARKFDTSEKASTQPLRARSHDSYTARSTYNADLLNEFAGMDEDCLLGEATNVKESRKEDTVVEPPALPQKSSLRASRILDSLKLSSIESATQSLTTPHDAYMSSEEDASSSADEFSDYDFDSCSEASQGASVRRKSYEDTARVVSVIYSGKPSLVDLPSPRRSTTSSASDTESDISIETPIDHPAADGHPPRTSSLIPTTPPSFLKEDPFAETRYVPDAARDGQLDGPLRVSKAPAVLNRVQRTFSLVRKRSRPFLRTASSTMSRDDLILPPLPVSTINLPSLITSTAEQAAEAKGAAEVVESPRSPVKYNDIIKAARKNKHAASKSISAASLPLTPITPITPTCPVASKRGILSGLKANRRSMKP
ncbi:hypothetical protein BKA67DRAFT_538953 [Truncatella angustata]|uniref:Uncharacterized protein n=1 Tax=Truncatella angustata TaxID=152316 RepID=A0A9P8UFG4_9PEZI|nr:uncharacterized protein BKA67DRAFT_538953 [Truncatella angustata]KAH6648944.1 hypothetical protein BKA67DRAFT_538953 [Truncatella angustata]KAH8198606.1 hypothetical protein TruAng_007238 [Truncatella angustata]